jgi:hypothetical protein
MRVVVENSTGQMVRAPWPLNAEIKDGHSTEFPDVADNGIPLVMVMGFAQSAQKMAGLTVRFFRGDPEKEYVVVRVGPMPHLRCVED